MVAHRPARACARTRAPRLAPRVAGLAAPVGVRGNAAVAVQTARPGAPVAARAVAAAVAPVAEAALGAAAGVTADAGVGVRGGAALVVPRRAARGVTHLADTGV